jgi:hypothetical protein
MKNDLLEFINEQIHEGEKLKQKARGRELDTLVGFIQALHEVFEFVEEYDDEE